MTGRRYDQAELEHLKSRTMLSDIFARYGVPARGRGSEKWAVCCFHGEKTASLKIDDKKGRYHCFGCGAAGDHFGVLIQLGGKTFREAVEALGGLSFITDEDRRRVEERQRQWADEERQERERTADRIQKVFASSKPIGGTHVEAYLKARALPVTQRWTFDIRFVPNLIYRGYVDGNAEEPTDLGAFPAMVAAIRDQHGALIGLHRTYLDRDRPAKLSPPGDPVRNKAKKVLGEQKGGMIRLSPIGPRLATGEGIETTQSWFALGYGGDCDIAMAASVSLGNMTGKCTAYVEHPINPKRRIPNGEPDLDNPGIVLPPEVEEVTLIGDGDSDPATTKAALIVAGRRFRVQGRKVFISMAPEDTDFSDILQREGEAA